MHNKKWRKNANNREEAKQFSLHIICSSLPTCPPLASSNLAQIIPDSQALSFMKNSKPFFLSLEFLCFHNSLTSLHIICSVFLTVCYSPNKQATLWRFWICIILFFFFILSKLSSKQMEKVKIHAS